MLSFTNSWDKQSKNIYSIVLIIFSISVLALGIVFFLGTEFFFSWTTEAEISTLKTAIDTFDVGIFQFFIESDVYLPVQTFFGADPKPNAEIVVLCMALLMLIICISLTTLSFLNNWVYYFGTTLCVIFILFQQPEVLFTAFTFNKIITVAPILLFGGASYWFFGFQKNASFLIRLLIFLVISILYYSITFYFNGLERSAFYLWSYTSISAICIAILFIAFVAFEIVYGLLKLVSLNAIAGQKQGNSTHFLIIFFLYMTNLVLQYLKNSNKIDFELLPISPFVVLAISSLLGIYGMKDRSVMYGIQLPFYPFGAVLYLAWASFSFITIAYFFVSGNDAIVEVFEDAIHYTHIGFGIGFFMYVALNYRKWMEENLPVAKMVFSHQFVSFYSVYGTGILIVLTLFFYSNMFTYNQAMAGWYANIGDAYLYDDEAVLSEEYFGKSLMYEFQNHKSNYTMASIFKRKNNLNDAKYLYQKAVLKKPTPIAFANMAMIYAYDGQTLEAIFRLKKGIENFPKSAELHNNLALLFHQIKMNDSCMFYLNKALKINNLEAIASNKIAFSTTFKIPLNDTTELLKNSIDKTLNTNIIAYKILNKMNASGNESYLVDTALTEKNHAYIQNYQLYNLNKIDSNEISVIEKLMLKDTLASYRNELVFLKAIKEFYSGDKLKAFRSVDDLQLGNEQTAGKYLNTLGLWAMKLRLFDMASEIFALAVSKGEKTSVINQAIASAEAGHKLQAIDLLKSIEHTDSSASDILYLFGRIYATSFDKILIENDDIKYQYLHYNISHLTENQSGNLFFSIIKPELKYKAGVDLFYSFFENNKLKLCAEILNEIDKLNLTESQKLEFSKLKIKYLISVGDIQSLENEIRTTKNVEYGNLGKAFLAFKNNQLTECERIFTSTYKKLLHDNQVVVLVAEYFESQKNNKIAYDILLEGITINHFSAKLYKAFTLQALKFGIPSFAESGLREVQKLTTEKEFLEFNKIYEKQKAISIEFQ